MTICDIPQQDAVDALSQCYWDDNITIDRLLKNAENQAWTTVISRKNKYKYQSQHFTEFKGTAKARKPTKYGPVRKQQKTKPSPGTPSRLNFKITQKKTNKALNTSTAPGTAISRTKPVQSQNRKGRKPGSETEGYFGGTVAGDQLKQLDGITTTRSAMKVVNANFSSKRKDSRIPQYCRMHRKSNTKSYHVRKEVIATGAQARHSHNREEGSLAYTEGSTARRGVGWKAPPTRIEPPSDHGDQDFQREPEKQIPSLEESTSPVSDEGNGLKGVKFVPPSSGEAIGAIFENPVNIPVENSILCSHETTEPLRDVTEMSAKAGHSDMKDRNNSILFHAQIGRTSLNVNIAGQPVLTSGIDTVENGISDKNKDGNKACIASEGSLDFQQCPVLRTPTHQAHIGSNERDTGLTNFSKRNFADEPRLSVPVGPDIELQRGDSSNILLDHLKWDSLRAQCCNVPFYHLRTQTWYPAGPWIAQVMGDTPRSDRLYGHTEQIEPLGYGDTNDFTAAPITMNGTTYYVPSCEPGEGNIVPYDIEQIGVYHTELPTIGWFPSDTFVS